jgi:hypothetical protein
LALVAGWFFISHIRGKIFSLGCPNRQEVGAFIFTHAGMAFDPYDANGMTIELL